MTSHRVHKSLEFSLNVPQFGGLGNVDCVLNFGMDRGSIGGYNCNLI
jgi:hypothetical protein